MPAFFRNSIMKKYGISLLASTVFVSTAQADLFELSNPADMAGKQGWGTYASAYELMATDFVAAKNFDGNWGQSYSPRDGTNLAIGMARVEAGVTYDSWRLSGIYRSEQIITANRDLVDMVYYNKQHQSVAAGQTFNAILNAEGFVARGMRLDKGFELKLNDNTGLSLGAGISLLQGTRARFANASGTAASTASGYSYSATLNDSNSRATYPYIRPGTPEGSGYALDLGAKIIWTQGAHLDLAVNDLFSQMTWHNMPNTMETANSATLARDAAGYIYFNPTLTGTNSINRMTIVQKLPAQANAQFTYPAGNFDLFAGTGWMMGCWFPQFGTSYRINDDWKTSLDYDTQFRTIGIGIEHKYFMLGARSSNLVIGNAQAYGLNAAIHIPLE